MQCHIIQSQSWVWVELHFLKFGSKVGKFGTLKESGIYRDKTMHLQGLKTLGHKKQHQSPFLARRCKNTKEAECVKLIAQVL